MPSVVNNVRKNTGASHRTNGKINTMLERSAIAVIVEKTSQTGQIEQHGAKGVESVIIRHISINGNVNIAQR